MTSLEESEAQGGGQGSPRGLPPRMGKTKNGRRGVTPSSTPATRSQRCVPVSYFYGLSNLSTPFRVMDRGSIATLGYMKCPSAQGAVKRIESRTLTRRDKNC